MPISGSALYNFIKDRIDTATTDIDMDLDDLIPLDLQDPEVPGNEQAFMESDAFPMFEGWGGAGQEQSDLLAAPGGETHPTPPFQLDIQPRESIGLLERPGRAVAELLQGGKPLDALLGGKASKPSLGYALFPSAQKEGFQPLDIPAFAVDAVVDPLNLVFGAMGAKAFKAIGGIAYKAKNVDFFADAAKAAGLFKSPAKARGYLKNVFEGKAKKTFKTPKKQIQKGAEPMGVSGLSMTGRWRNDVLEDIEFDLGKKWGRTHKGGKEAWLTWDDVPDDDLPAVLSKLMGIQYRMQPAETTAVGNMRRFMGMKFMPVTSVLKTHAGEWGMRAGKGIDEFMQDYLIGYGNMSKNFLTKLDDLEMLGNQSEKARMAATIVAEAGGKKAGPGEIMNTLMNWGGEKAGRGGAKVLKEGMEGTLDELADLAADPKVKDLGQNIREMMDYYEGRFRMFVDPSGRQFKVIVKDAGKRVQPMADHMIPNYVYHMWSPDALKRGTRGYDKFIKSQMDRLGVDRSTAEMLVEEGAKGKLNVIGALRHARQADIGGYELDPATWMMKYIDHAEYSLNLGAKFGVGGEDFTKVTDFLKKNEYLSPSWLDDIRDVVLRRQTKDYNAGELIRKLTAFQVVTKMGVGSTIANASQNINTIARDGLINFMKGVQKTQTTQGQKYGAIAYNRAIQDSLHELMLGAVPHRLAGRYLDVTGFSYVEKWNRFFAANSATVTVERMVDKMRRLDPGSKGYNRIKSRLTEYGLREDDLRQLAGGAKKLSEQSMERIALRGSEVTQHATNWHQLPQIWRTPTARLALQYKNFAYNQTRFVFQEIFKPAIQYVGSKGAEGSIAPLMRFAPLFIGGGSAVSYLRDFIKRPVRGALTGDWEGQEEMFWESDDPLAAMARDTLMVGSIGIMGDAWTAAERGKLMEWAAGPTIGDISELAKKGTLTAKHAYEGKDVSKDFHNFRNWAFRRAVPGLGPHVPYDVDLSEFFYGKE